MIEKIIHETEISSSIGPIQRIYYDMCPLDSVKGSLIFGWPLPLKDNEYFEQECEKCNPFSYVQKEPIEIVIKTFKTKMIDYENYQDYEFIRGKEVNSVTIKNVLINANYYACLNGKICLDPNQNYKFLGERLIENVNKQSN